MSDHVDALAIALGLAPKLSSAFITAYGKPIPLHPLPDLEAFYEPNEEYEESEEEQIDSAWKNLIPAVLPVGAPPQHLLKNWTFDTSENDFPVTIRIKGLNHLTLEEAKQRVKEMFTHAMEIKIILADKAGIHYDTVIHLCPDNIDASFLSEK